MAEEILRRAARAITDLRRLATILNDSGYPASAIRLHGFAGMLKSIEGELVDAQTKMDGRSVRECEDAMPICNADMPCLPTRSTLTREKTPNLAVDCGMRRS